MSNFKIVSEDKKARTGVLTTGHGLVETPIFMPVGTQGTVKALSPKDLKDSGAQIILGNTYHLYLRPGSKLIKKMGGLHKFMGWDGPILTDSGGFQAFSLGAAISHGVKKVQHSGAGPADKDNALSPLVSKMTEEGVEFVSHLDGSKHLLTPEKSIEVQLDLGSDICLVLDELLSPLHTPKYVKQSLERTHRWELRSKEYFEKHVNRRPGGSLRPIGPNSKDSIGRRGDLQNDTNGVGPQLFGILQGVYNQKVREEEAKWVSDQDFDGISIGGSFGTSEYYPFRRPGGSLRPIGPNSKDSIGRRGDLQNDGLDFDSDVDWAASKAIDQTMDWVVPFLPKEWPKHALGIGEVRDIFECVGRGIDMFDCVAPTRRARNGSLYISPQNGGNVKNKFTLAIARSEFKDDPQPINLGCNCYTCQNFSRAYLRHLYLASEILYHHLATIHNVYFMVHLTKKIRESILNHQFSSLKKKWLN
ncbi:MAG: tRNA-guanine transglycosylase [Patescibacteria group bacterium]|nr:tRNA-guanine transglycosylase [Patescibacteria group bacterium]